MTRKLNNNYSLRVVAAFIAILTFLIAAVVLAQTPGAGQPTVNANTVLAPAGISFLPAVAYDSGGSYPEFLAVADMNGDGRPDVVVVNYYSYSVDVLLGNGNGTFQPAVAYRAGGTPSSVALADVNGDGKPDIVVGNNGNVGVLLGNGNGTFQPVVTHPSGGEGQWFQTPVAIADVNGDGKPDIVLANSGAVSGPSNVGVLLGNGDGTFQPVVTYGSGGFTPDSVAVADVSGDGRLDILVANQFCYSSDSCSALGVLLGNGDGTFQTAVSYVL